VDRVPSVWEPRSVRLRNWRDRDRPSVWSDDEHRLAARPASPSRDPCRRGHRYGDAA
jgi:hypothetical protein